MQNGGTAPANDIILRCADAIATKAISRWHFQLIRRPDGVVLRPLTDASTEVNGRPLAKGEEVRVWPGDWVRVSRVLTVWFEAPNVDVDRTALEADSALRQVRSSCAKSSSSSEV
jgi:predicted component of type VI protein secretion system